MHHQGDSEHMGSELAQLLSVFRHCSFLSEESIVPIIFMVVLFSPWSPVCNSFSLADDICEESKI
jgi:hypothetical protein